MGLFTIQAAVKRAACFIDGSIVHLSERSQVYLTATPNVTSSKSYGRTLDTAVFDNHV